MSTSVVGAARIIDRLARSQTPMTLAEIASELGLPRSTAYTILRDLAQRIPRGRVLAARPVAGRALT
jgi:predicted transcriptional regulator